ncbi:zinc-binding dehydrogenase [Sphingomonas sp. 1185]|uniref:zinc-binding dehydrogenase n=1 Tax=Sphingomonas sp. 1185 TaxID=3156411 RepID=UPI0033955D07
MAGICGTDLRHWEKAEEELHCCIMSHELAGEVVEIGSAVTRVAIIDRMPHALALGADRTVHSDDDPQAAVGAMTDDRGADIVFECAGGESMPDTLPLATRLVRRGGKVVIVGGFDDGAIAIPLEWQRIQMSEITLIPSASFAFYDIHAEQVEVIDLVARGVLKTQELITHRFPLDRINDAFEAAQDRGRTGAIFVGLTI